MKTVILAGGFGTRISEESQFRPKPMLEIGEMPILWHIMKEYSHYGFNDFIICAGYKQHVIKEWFADYFLHTSDVTFDYTSGKNDIIIHNKRVEPWKVTVVDTGLNTMTGGRIKRIKEYVGEEPFMLTYGDAVGNIDINELLKFHLQNGKIGTISVYNFGQNKGVLDVNPDGKVNAFREKSDLDGDMIACWESMSIEEHMAYYEEQGMDNKSAMKQVAKDRGVGKREIYQYLHGNS